MGKIKRQRKTNAIRIWCLGRSAMGTLLTLMSMLPASCSAEEIKDTDCISPTRIHRSSAYRDLSYDELRALALTHEGHLEESIPWYLKALDTKNDFSNRLELSCGQTYEALGNIPEALKHYEKGETYSTGPARAALLVKQGRLNDALDVCSRGVSESRKGQVEYLSQDYDSEFCKWLQRRSAVEVSLNHYKAAAADLKEAALWFAQDNSEQLQQCIDEYEKIRRHLKVNDSLLIKASDLPTEDKKSVFNVLNLFATTSKPISVQTLNKLIGAKLKVPGGAFVEPHADQKQYVTPSLSQVDYENTRGYDADSASINLRIGTKRCALDHDLVESILPADKRQQSLTIDRYSGFPIQDSESWSLPAGTLVLTFGHSGYRILKEIEFRANGIRDEKPNSPMSCMGCAVHLENHGDIENALMLISRSNRIVKARGQATWSFL